MWNRLRRVVGKKSRQTPLLLSVEALEDRALPAPFTAGNLVLLRVGDGVTTLSNAAFAGTLVELTTAGQNPSGGSNAVSLPSFTSGGNNQGGITFSGSATTAAGLGLSQDGRYLTTIGYDAQIGQTSVATTPSATASRNVVRVDANGDVVLVARLTDAYGGDNARAVVSTDGTAFYTTGTGSGNGARFFTYSGTTATTTTQILAGNLRQVDIVDGNLVYTNQTTINRFSGLPTAAATGTSLGVTLSDAGEFQFLDRAAGVGDPNLGGAVDTLYVANNTAANAVAKYFWDGSTWAAAGTATLSGGLFGIVGRVSGTNAELFGTTNSSSTSSLQGFTDTAAYNATIAGSFTTLASAGANFWFRGIAFAPEAAGNQAPTVTLPGGAVTYTENVAATILDATATVSDPDSPNFDTGTLTVDFSANGTADDRLEIRNQGTGAGQIGVSGSNVTFGGTTIGTFSGGSGTTPLVVTFNASATPAAVEALARNVTFRNVSEAPSASTRTVRFVVTDGDGGTSTAVTKTVNVVAVNDAPSGADQSRFIDEDTSYTFNPTEFGFTDPNDNPANTRLGLKITTLPTAGTLTYDNSPVTAGQVIPISLAGLLIYAPVPNEANISGYATFTFQVQDDGGTANGGIDLDPTPNTFEFKVRPVNDAPVVTLSGGTVSYTENGDPVVIDAAATVTDIDSGNFDSGSLTIEFTSGGTADDRLGIINQGTGFQQLGVNGNTVTYNNGVGVTIFGTFTGGTGTTPLVFQFNAAAQVFIVETLLRNITFSNVSDNPSTAPRTLRVVVVDDFDSPNNTSAPVTRTVNVTAVNDAPAGTDKTVTTNEDVAYTFTAADFGFTDVDANALFAVKITTAPTAGALTLDGIAVTPTLLVLAADIAAGKLKFTPESNANGTGYATFTFQVQDNGGTANGGIDLDPTANTITVDVLSVNDAPTFTAAATNPTFTEDGPAVTLFSGAAASTVEGDQSIDALVLTISGVADSSEEFLVIDGTSVGVTFNGTFTTSSGLTAAVVTNEFGTSATVTITKSGGFAPSVAVGLANALAYSNVSNRPTVGNRVVTFTSIKDTGGTANSGSDTTALSVASTVAVVAVNDAPGLEGVVDFTAINEDDTANGGTLLATMVAERIPDPDGPATGIAITATNTANGSWEYTTNGGSNWIAVGAVSNTSALLLLADANTRLRFVPNANFNGTVSNAITIRAWDASTGSVGTKVDVSSNGGTTAFSTATASNSITVNSVNDAPSGTDKTVSTTTNTAYTFAVADFGFTDVDANALLAVKITTLPTAGALALDGVAVTAGQFVSATDISGGKLKFTPATNASGSPYTTFTFQVRDDGGTANGGADLDQGANTIIVNVVAVNNAPAGTDATVTTNEDVAYTFATTDFGFTDVDANMLLAVQITTLPAAGVLTNNGAAVTAGQFVSAADITAGLLAFAPASNASGTGYATFTFQVQDDGGTANGGIDLDQSANTLTVNVTAVNDAPSGADKTVTTLEDTVYTFTAADFGFTDPIDSPANALLAVQITTLPAAGTLALNGVGVTAGQFVSAADITAGLLTFTPAPNANGTGYASFTFQVQDDGGTANGGIDTDPTPNTITVDVTPVNDAPILTASNGTPTYTENGPPVLVDAALTLTDDGPTVTGATVTFTAGFVPFQDELSFTPLGNIGGIYVFNTGVLTLFGTDTVANYLTALRSLTFRASGENPSTSARTLSITATDGADTSLPVTITVNVVAVNDAPAGADKTVATLEDTAYTFATTDFGFTDVDANALLAVQITTLPATGTLTNNGVAVTAGQFVSAADITAGLLAFAPASNASGTGYATFTFQVQDDGGTANGGIDLDQSANTLTVNVTAVNDAPSGADKTVTTLEDTVYTFATTDFGFTDVENNALLAVQITTLPGAGTLALNGVAVTAGEFVPVADITAGLLVFTPASNASGTGYATFTFQVQDDGGTANGGIDLDQSANTLTVNVTAVNDAPSGADATVTTLEDTVYTFTAADFGFTDPIDSPANALLAVQITTLPAAGTLTNNGIAVTAGEFVPVADIAAGKLTFTPAANANGTGYASFTFQVQDDGGTANGGVDLAQAPSTITVDVTAVSDAPVGADAMITITEDTVYTFAPTDFSFTDPNDTPADAFAGVVVTTLPAVGTLRNNGIAVTAGQFVSTADIAAGLLTFTPAANATATATFTFQVRDAGTTGPNLDPTPNTTSVSITAVNDAPTVALVAQTVVVRQDSGSFGRSNFATFAPGGGADEATQTPVYQVANTNNALFSAQPTIGTDGRLTFTPAPGMSGTVTVTVTVRDNGSNVAPNNNSASVQFTITVLAAVGPRVVAVGSDAGGPAQVRVLNVTTGAVRDFIPFGPFAGGVRVAVADTTGDGTDDVIVATASQFGLVAVFDGVTGGLVNTYLPFGLFPSGLQIATGDLNGDGRQDLVFGLDSGAPIVVAIDGSTGAVLRVINAIPGFTGGVRLAVGDVTGDGLADITTVAGPGGNGLVVSYDGATGGVASAFFTFPGLPGEVNLAVGDVTGDGLADLVAGVQLPGGTFLGAFTPTGQLARGYIVPATAPAGPSAARVNLTDLNADGIADLLVSDRPGLPGGKMFVVNGATGEILDQQLAFERITSDPLFGGVFVETN